MKLITIQLVKLLYTDIFTYPFSIIHHNGGNDVTGK